MAAAEWVHARFTRKQPWLIAGVALMVILSALAFSSQQHWRHRADALERENLNLKLDRLARGTKTDLNQPLIVGLNAAAPVSAAVPVNATVANLGTRPGGDMVAVYVLAAAALLLALVAVAAVKFRRYVRHQKSVDARYKAIIDQANDGIVIVDAKTQELLYTNPAILSRLGYTSAEAQALTLSDVFADGSATAESVLARLR